MIAPLAGEGERAFVADDIGLVEVALTGGSQVIAPDSVSWCGVDARAQVVWFVTQRGLHAFDLVDRRTHAIIAAELPEIAVIIDWGAEKLGGEDPLAFDVGAAIGMTSAPAIKTVMGCEGDREVYCFEEDGTTPTAEVKKSQQRAAALKLVDPVYVAAIAGRGATGSLWAPPPVPPTMPTRKPVVPRKQCSEEPGECGSLTAIPSSPLWLVETGNSRGDYYHQSRELWDPRTGEFVRIADGKIVRSKVSSDIESTGDYAGLRVSNGTLSHIGAVFDDTKIIYAPKAVDGTPTSCGFTAGGWRVKGPTG
ncbi:MAG: hypothetical protein H0T76_12715 [Nannocystis sp.]|nr:hypothetical protein [Nannocystis sp.]MBA3547341.1 hypothetical protein [Nannocystis sp.]